MSSFDRVERDDTPVVFLRAAADEQAGIEAVWQRLESVVGSLRGRHFLATFDPATAEYRACVEVREGDDSDALGLERDVVPGGTYLRARLRGEPPGLYRRIRPTFEELVRAAEPDRSRPSLELYRRHDQVDLLLPIASE